MPVQLFVGHYTSGLGDTVSAAPDVCWTVSALQAPLRELKRGPAGTGAVTLQDAEREAIGRALREAGGKVGGEQGAAAKLGMKRTTLQAKMRKLGIDAKSS